MFADMPNELIHDMERNSSLFPGEQKDGRGSTET
jgi:hypothetical protein